MIKTANQFKSNRIESFHRTVTSVNLRKKPPRLRRLLAAALTCITLASCGKSLSGKYVCKGGGIAETLEFRDSQNVMVTAMGINFPTTYRYQGGYVYVKHDKGGDFSFKVENPDSLLGEDRWSKGAKCKKSK